VDVAGDRHGVRLRERDARRHDPREAGEVVDVELRDGEVAADGAALSPGQAVAARARRDEDGVPAPHRRRSPLAAAAAASDRDEDDDGGCCERAHR
jgi:hypothetical protein